MWTKSRLCLDPWDIESYRQWKWSQWYRDRGGMVTDLIGVTPQGWVLYEVFGPDSFGAVFYRMAIENESGHVTQYPISEEEFWGNPAMPLGWAIPF